MRAPAIALSAVVLAGCIPDLSGYRIVQEGDPPPPGVDGGAETPNPIDLGEPCPNPHILVGTVVGTSSSARLRRIDPSTNAACRVSPILEEQRAFGFRIADVDWHPETGAVLGLDEAVLGLDAEGFPAWRHDPFDYGRFGGDWVAVFGTGANARVAVAWVEGASGINKLRLLDTRGIQTSGDIEVQSAAAAIAPHPDGTARLVMPTRYGVTLDVYEPTDSTTSLGPGNATPLFPADTEELTRSHGYRVHVASDVAMQRLVITHQYGLVFYQLGGAAPDTVYDCASYCESFHAAAPDPDSPDAAYAICQGAGSSKRHLVHVAPESCSLVIDGTSLGTHTLQDVTLVRAEL